MRSYGASFFFLCSHLPTSGETCLNRIGSDYALHRRVAPVGGGLLQSGVFALGSNEWLDGHLSLELFLARGAQALEARCQACFARLGPELRRLRHAHHLVSYPVGFLLVEVVGPADGELGLNGSRAQRALYAL